MIQRERAHGCWEKIYTGDHLEAAGILETFGEAARSAKQVDHP
jgi:hypothetical protein